MNEEKFCRTTLESLGEEARNKRLQELQDILTSRFSEISEHLEFFKEIDPTIAELKEIGHDLWSWDYDGEKTEVYGGDYMRPETAGKLVIEFTFPKVIKVKWEDINDR